MKAKSEIFFLLLVLLAVTTAIAQAEPSDCQSQNLPTTWSFTDKVGDIAENSASLGSGGGGSVSFLFRSRLEKPVSGLALVLEYLNQEAEIVSVPVVGQVVPGTSPSPPNVLSSAGAWSNELAPGDSALMTGVTHGISTNHCPSQARVTFASIHFADGTYRTFSSPDWHLAASPRFIPNTSESIPDAPVRESVSALGKLKVSAAGDVFGITAASVPPDLLRWVRNRMQDWKFYPALLNARPVDSELTVLFLIQAKGASPPKPLEHSRPVTVIRFGWSSDLSSSTATSRWLEFYGALTNGTALGSPLAQFIPRPKQKPN